MAVKTTSIYGGSSSITGGGENARVVRHGNRVFFFWGRQR